MERMDEEHPVLASEGGRVAPLSQRRDWGAWGSVVLVLLGVGVCFHRVIWVAPVDRVLRRAAVALSCHQYHEAQQLADRVLKQAPNSVQALLIAGESAAGLYDSPRAIRYFQRVPDDGSPAAVRALYGTGERLLRLGRVSEAEERFRQALRDNPRHFSANKQLGFLLQVEGRTWEAVGPAKQMIRQGRFGGDQLQMLGLTEVMFVRDDRFVRSCLAAAPDDPLPLLGDARRDLLKGRTDHAEHLLRKIVAADPGQIEAQARLGRILLQSDREEAFLKWQRQLPAAADGHPEIWFNRGLWAQRRKQQRAAVRCFLETVRLSPNHVSANHRLSQMLAVVGEHGLAEEFAQRAADLAKLELALIGLYEDPTIKEMHGAVDLLESLGRFWEAAAMCDIARRMSAEPLEWADRGLKRFSKMLDAGDSFTIPSALPANRIDMTTYPLPDWKVEASTVSGPASSPDTCHVTFVDSAQQSGFEFTYFNGSASPKGLEHIFETIGGGVAVLDYDGDNWPDLYLTQGADLWKPAKQTQHRDRLFRNLGDGRFADVSEQAGLGDKSFSQGVTVGDFNNDGFPDLYVANLGANRFYENNGDGTFRDITDQTGTAGEEWTTSCLLADLNGDAFADLYAVNYLRREEVIDRRCKKNGRPLTCLPTMFSAEQDRLYLNLGDGRFEEVTERCGILRPDGKGLGILAADFDESGRLSLFVGNDTAINFFFVNETANRGGELSFSDQAALSGLGVDGEGHVQATMGIAAGDADGDGLLDLFTTDFYGDANTLYVHQPGHVFLDGTQPAHLDASSYEMLGFGTQFLDGELDGFPDLVVTNGHVDRSFATGEPDEMPPQYYRNVGGGRFVEVRGPSLGPYFQGKYLGRALARLDWNRDGKEDVCVSHLHAPVALLTNQTPDTGHFLAVRLCGVNSDRDAIGTTVGVKAGKQRWTGQLTAGDGYLTSNQRQLVFGLGSAAVIDELVVRWPAGLEQRFTEVVADQQLLLIEGRRQPVELPPAR